MNISCLPSSYCPGFHIPLHASGYPGEESEVRSQCHAICLLLNSLIGTKLSATDAYLACDSSGMNGRSSAQKHPQKSQATHFLHIIASGHTVMRSAWQDLHYRFRTQGGISPGDPLQRSTRRFQRQPVSQVASFTDFNSCNK